MLQLLIDMRPHDLSAWTPSHVFDSGNPAAEKGAWRVVILTAVMMVVELWAGWRFNSMALLADGWHMSSHVLAIGVAAMAYWLARRHAADNRFAFGTWKIEILGGFASAVFLLGIALLMAVESLQRITNPLGISFNQAILVAIVGLLVNVVSAGLLHGGHQHGHEHEHEHEHTHHEHTHGAATHADQHGHTDLNLRSAYLHVLADAATSVLAIVALLGGKYFGWIWLDPVMGIVGAVLVGIWAVGLLRESGAVLLDREADDSKRTALLALVKSVPGGDVDVADAHLWRVGRARYACILTLVTHRTDLTADAVRNWLASRTDIVHLTVEINHCGHCS